MKNKKRALRRHHYFRLKKERCHYRQMQGHSEDHLNKYSGVYARTPCRCSCMICRNPRRSYRGKDALTVQELKALDWYDGKPDADWR